MRKPMSWICGILVLLSSVFAVITASETAESKKKAIALLARLSEATNLNVTLGADKVEYWPEYLAYMPAALANLGQIITVAENEDFSMLDYASAEEFSSIKNPASFKAAILQLNNEILTAFEVANQNMPQVPKLLSNMLANAEQVNTYAQPPYEYEQLAKTKVPLTKIENDMNTYNSTTAEILALFDHILRVLTDLHKIERWSPGRGLSPVAVMHSFPYAQPETSAGTIPVVDALLQSLGKLPKEWEAVALAMATLMGESRYNYIVKNISLPALDLRNNTNSSVQRSKEQHHANVAQIKPQILTFNKQLGIVGELFENLTQQAQKDKKLVDISAAAHILLGIANITEFVITARNHSVTFINDLMKKISQVEKIASGCKPNMTIQQMNILVEQIQNLQIDLYKWILAQEGITDQDTNSVTLFKKAALEKLISEKNSSLQRFQVTMPIEIDTTSSMRSVFGRHRDKFFDLKLNWQQLADYIFDVHYATSTFQKLYAAVFNSVNVSINGNATNLGGMNSNKTIAISGKNNLAMAAEYGKIRPAIAAFCKVATHVKGVTELYSNISKSYFMPTVAAVEVLKQSPNPKHLEQLNNNLTTVAENIKNVVKEYKREAMKALVNQLARL